MTQCVRAATCVKYVICVLATLSLVCACKRNPPEAEGPPGSKAEPAKPIYEGARKTAFTQVTRQLDPGGSLYVFLSTDQWLAGLSTNVNRLGELIQDLPNLPEPQRAQAEHVLGALSRAIARSGVEQLAGVGISSVQVSPELYRSKVIWHRSESKGEGLLWKLMGAQAHPMTLLDMLPQNTALALGGDLDLQAIWDALEQILSDAGVPEAAHALRNWQDSFEQQTQLSLTNLLASFGGEAGLILTLDDTRTISIPGPEQPLDLPEPAILFLLKVRNDTLYTHLSQKLKENPATTVTEEAGLKISSMPLPLPLPVPVELTVASSGDYFFAASSPQLVRAVQQARRGGASNLVQSAAFKAMRQHLPSEGNQFVYSGRRLSETVQKLQRQALKAGNQAGGPSAFIEQWLLRKQPTFGLSIGGRTPTGWQIVTVGNVDFAGPVLLAPLAAGVAIPAAMVLPAMSNAKSRAQSINCVNNLKQVALAFKIWAVDHGDKFPFNVSTSKGGSLELCDPGPDGFDRNPSKHFKILAEEMVNPRILVCPADSSKQPAASFADLQDANVTYQLRCGKDLGDQSPQEVLIHCPIHGNDALCDGSVWQRGRK